MTHLSPLEARILDTIKANPGIAAKELAFELNSTATSIRVTMYGLTKRGFKLKRGYVFKSEDVSRVS